MNKFLKAFYLSFIIIIGVLILTGCGDKKEANNNSKSVFEVEQVSDKNVKIKLSNAKKDEYKTAKIIIDEGENISTKTKMEGADEVYLYYFKAGTKHDRNRADSELLNGEGESSTEDFPAGEYELEFVVSSETATGDIEIEIK